MAGRVAIPDVSGDIRIPIKTLLLTPTPLLQLHLFPHPTADSQVTDMPPKAKMSKKRARSPASATTKAAGDRTQPRSSKRTKKDASAVAADEPEPQVSNVPHPNDAFSTTSDDMSAGGRRRH